MTARPQQAGSTISLPSALRTSANPRPRREVRAGQVSVLQSASNQPIIKS